MKRNKKTVLILLCVLALILAAGAACLGSRVMPTVNHALHISQLLQPVIEAENYTMHLSLSAEIGEKPLAIESDVFMVTESDIRYTALEQNGSTIYLVDDLLLLENGKAFRTVDTMQPESTAYSELLSKISAMYGIFTIACEEQEHNTSYSITITGDALASLLAAIPHGDRLPLEAVTALELCLTETDGTLECVHFQGSGTANGTSIVLNMTLSGFRALASGDYPIPEAVAQSAATVDPDSLFCLTEDLYRLVLALLPLEDMHNIDGYLELTADCGLIQLDTQIPLSDLDTASLSQVNPENLQRLPELLGLLCTEGDVCCTQEGSRWLYTLELDQASIQMLAGMILPEMAGYSEGLTQGQVSIIMEAEQISSMAVSIQGTINALIARIPISLCAAFTFG